MADKTVAKLSVEIEAKLRKLDSDMKQAEQRVDKAAKKMKQSVDNAKPFGSVTEGLAKAFAMMGAIEGGAKALHGVMALVEGDAEGALAAFESMPFGIGPAVTAVKDLALELTGVNDELEKIDKKAKQIAKDESRFQNQMKTRFTTREQLTKRIADAEDRLAVAGVQGGEEKEQRALEVRSDQINRAIDDLRQKMMDTGAVIDKQTADLFQRAQDLQGQEFAAQTKDIQRRIEEREAKRKQAEEQAAQKRIGNITRIEKAIGIAQLKQSGKLAEAQAAQIKESFRERIEAAANDPKLAGVLKRLRDIQIKAIKTKDEKPKTVGVSRSAQEVSLTQTAFQQQRGGNVQVKQLKVQEEMAKGIKKIANEPRIGQAAAWQ